MLRRPAGVTLAAARHAEALAGIALEAVAVPALRGCLLPAVMAAMRRGRADPKSRQQSDRDSEGAHAKILLRWENRVSEPAGKGQPHGCRLDRVEVAIGDAARLLARQA
jgi:hypothetical protein